MKIRFTVLILIFLAATGCRKDKAEWGSNWVVPLVKDSLLIKDYVNDSTLAINPGNSIQVVADRRLIDLDLSTLIEIPDTLVEQTFNISANALPINPGVSFIDEIQEHEFSFEDVALTSVRIKSGIAKIEIENPVATDGIFTISLPGVYKNGTVFSHTQKVDAGTSADPGSGELELNLKGYTIDMTGKNGDLYNLLQSEMNVSTDPNGEAITITNQDVFKTKVEFKSLVVDYAKGYFGNVVFSDTTILDIEELANITGGAINIEDVNLELIIRNGIKARASGEISLFESVNYDSNMVALSHPYFGQQLNVEPAMGSWNAITPSELSFLFNESTGDMEPFLENLGSNYKVGYAIELNPLGGTSFGNDVLFPQSRLGVDLKADFPLLIGADNLTLQDTFEIDFKNDSKLLRVESGRLILNTVNTFPYGAEVKLFLLDENENNIKEIASTGKVTPAQTNNNGDGHIPMEEKMEFVVDEEAAKLLSETKSIMVKAVFNSTTYTNNKVYANAALQLLLSSELKLRSEL